MLSYNEEDLWPGGRIPYEIAPSFDGNFNLYSSIVQYFI